MITLGIGTVLGFASGIYSLRWRHFGHDGQGHWHGRHHAAFEARVADICTRSAERVFRGQAAPTQTPAPTP
jgi:hypothetical protein